MEREHSMHGGRSHDAAASRPFEFVFDPAELYGTQIPFVDPFGYTDRDFQALSIPKPDGVEGPKRKRPLPAHPAPNAHRAPANDQHIPHVHIPLQRAASLAGPSTQHSGPELPPPTERTRLTEEQALHIFHLRRTKKTGTAALLATEYNVSPKAIRDIWTGKTWFEITRAYWSN